MSNEGEYLILVNDLRDQYLELKDKYNRKIASLEEKITHMEMDMGLKPELVYVKTQFHSSRPFAEYGMYVNTNCVTKLYLCVKCSLYHPIDTTC